MHNFWRHDAPASGRVHVLVVMQEVQLAAPMQDANATPSVPRRGRMTSEQALAAAASEGLTLALASKPGGTTGFWGVTKHAPAGQPAIFSGRLKHAGHLIHVGTFDTAEEAALTLARRFPSFVTAAIQKQQQPSPPPLTRTEVEILARAEGLTLLKAPPGAKTEFQGVNHDPKRSDRRAMHTKQFCASTRAYRGSLVAASVLSRKHAGSPVRSLGRFATPHEAALAIARDLGPETTAVIAAGTTSVEHCQGWRGAGWTGPNSNKRHELRVRDLCAAPPGEKRKRQPPGWLAEHDEGGDEEDDHDDAEEEELLCDADDDEAEPPLEVIAIAVDDDDDAEAIDAIPVFWV